MAFIETKWYKDEHDNLASANEADHRAIKEIVKTVSPWAPPGDYPYSVEIFTPAEKGEDGADRFVIGGTHTRTHHGPW